MAVVLDWLSRGFIAAGIILLLLSGYLYYESLPGPAVTIDDMERTIADLAPGRTLELTFVLHNPRREPVRIVGLAEC